MENEEETDPQEYGKQSPDNYKLACHNCVAYLILKKQTVHQDQKITKTPTEFLSRLH